MKKSWFYTLLLIVATVCAIAGWSSYVLFTPVVTAPAGIIYNLKPGAKKQQVISELTVLRLVRHPITFSIFAYPQVDAHLKAGEYLFPSGSTNFSIWRQLTTGRGQLIHAFAIIPGYSFAQIKLLLAQSNNFHHVVGTLNDEQIMSALGKANVSPEGMFFPDTYHYTKGVSDFVILKRAFELMQKKLNAAWEARDSDLPYRSAYEALIVASLVEKEAQLSTERPLIAGVIINRLNKGMLLQIDPTVVYGMGSRYQGKIFKSDLTADTPYNTYVHKGLPPTPIAMPSMASIQAALHPVKHDFYYFVAKGDGSHQFTATLPEHHKAVEAANKLKQPIVITPVVQPPKIVKPAVIVKPAIKHKKTALSERHSPKHHPKRNA